jgi:hypothetical protein
MSAKNPSGAKVAFLNAVDVFGLTLINAKMLRSEVKDL